MKTVKKESFTVIVQRPDYVTTELDDMHPIWHVMATDPQDAADTARCDIAAEDGGDDGDSVCLPEDYHVIAVFRGQVCNCFGG